MGCGSTEPDSNRYINSLPGMPLEAIDKIASSQQKTFLGVWNSVEDRSISKFSTRLISAFKSKYKIKSIRQSIDLGRVIDVTSSVAVNTDYAGGLIDLSLQNSDYVKSNLMMISFQSLAVYVTSVPTIAVPVKIYNDVTKEILFETTIPIDTVVGWYNIKVNKFFDASKLAFVYKTSEFESVKLELSPLVTNTFCGCATTYGCNGSLSGIRASDTTYLTTDTGTDTFGISAIFSLVCKYNKLICSNLVHFTDALWYLMGAEMMIERLYSPRLNFWTINDDDAKELVALYQTEFEKEMDIAIDGIDLDMADCCLECEKTLGYAQSIM